MAVQIDKTAPGGVRLAVAIVGNRNAGKSTLLNRLTGQDVSIVSDQPGTTTDAVAKAFELIPVGPVCFYDTAGLDDAGELGVYEFAEVIDALEQTLLFALADQYDNLRLARDCIAQASAVDRAELQLLGLVDRAQQPEHAAVQSPNESPLF